MIMNGGVQNGEVFQSMSLMIRGGLVLKQVKLEWYLLWKFMRVILGYLGWVCVLVVELENKWFVSGVGDRIIKIWDLVMGFLCLILIGYISIVCGLVVLL